MTSMETRNEKFAPGPMWRRVVAALLDLAIVFSVFFYAAERWGTNLENGARGWSGIPAGAIGLLLMGAYWVVPEWLFATTIGKAICNLRVTSIVHGEMDFVGAFQRNLLRPIDLLLFYSVGFIVAMSNKKRQRLGDLWARTIVVSSVREGIGN